MLNNLPDFTGEPLVDFLRTSEGFSSPPHYTPPDLDLDLWWHVALIIEK
jgi:hypothetical protein